jgi:hypothetical protein
LGSRRAFGLLMGFGLLMASHHPLGRARHCRRAPELLANSRWPLRRRAPTDTYVCHPLRVPPLVRLNAR